MGSRGIDGYDIQQLQGAPNALIVGLLFRQSSAFDWGEHL